MFHYKMLHISFPTGVIARMSLAADPESSTKSSIGVPLCAKCRRSNFSALCEMSQEGFIKPLR